MLVKGATGLFVIPYLIDVNQCLQLHVSVLDSGSPQWCCPKPWCLTAPSHHLNVDLSSVRSSAIQPGAISQEIPQPSITKFCLKIKFSSPRGQWVSDSILTTLVMLPTLATVSGPFRFRKGHWFGWGGPVRCEMEMEFACSLRSCQGHLPLWPQGHPIDACKGQNLSIL